MKRAILGIAALTSTILLVSCIDLKQNSNSNSNNNVLQKALLKSADNQPAQRVGIYELSIPSFENLSGTNPTLVTVTYSGGAQAALDAGCSAISLPNGLLASVGTNAPTGSIAAGGDYDSLLGGLSCHFAAAGSYLADIRISFTAGGVNYIANTTLNTVVP